jgi:type I restriction enzyme S subunit
MGQIHSGAHHWPRVPLVQVIRRAKDEITLDDEATYKQVTIRLWNRGVVQRGEQKGSEIRTKRQYRVRAGQLALSRIDVRNGAIGLIPFELDNAIVSNDFWAYDIDRANIDPSFLALFVTTPRFIEDADRTSSGTTKRIRAEEDAFLRIEIPLPPLAEQQRVVARIEALARRVEEARGLRAQAVEEAEALHGSAGAEALNRLGRTSLKTIGELCEVRGGLQKSPARVPRNNPTPYLTVAHVQRNRINTSSDFRYFEVSPDELPRWRLETGDLLIIEGNGSADQIGRVALFRGEIANCVHQNHVIRARPNRNVTETEFLNVYMNSPLA